MDKDWKHGSWDGCYDLEDPGTDHVLSLDQGLRNAPGAKMLIPADEYVNNERILRIGSDHCDCLLLDL